MTPNALLRQFFAQLGLTLWSLNWDRLGERQVEPILTALRWLPESQQELAEASLRNVFELACETGLEALRDVAGDRGADGLFARGPDYGTPYQRAMWMWLNQPDLFDQALLVHQVEHLAFWRKRNDLPQVEPRTDAETLEWLARELSELLTREQGRGRQCTVEHLRRSDGTDYYFAYADDFPHALMVHDADGTLTSRTVRRTFEIIFAYDRDAGTLELFAKVPTRLKSKLEEIFGWIVLDESLGPRVPRPVYDLNRLKDMQHGFETDAADRLHVELCRVRLDVKGTTDQIVLLRRDQSQDTVYDMFDDYLNRRKLPPSRIDISAATFRFRFGRIGGRRAGSLTVDIALPNFCNLRSTRPERIAMISKYLRQWRIALV
jgi:hypothetical protein